MTTNITVTPDPTGAVAGCGAIQRVIADGVHTVDFSAFNKASTSGNYINTLHVVNIFVYMFDGYNYNLTIFQNADEYPHEIDAWAARLLTAGYGISTPRKTAVQNFITALKTANVYNSITEMWLLEGGTAATNILSFKGGHDGVLHGTITHASTGSTGDGSTGWMDLGLSIDDLGSGDNIHLCAYLRKTVSAGTDAVGIRGVTSGQVVDTYISPRQSNGYYDIDGVYVGSYAPSDPSGRYILSRLGNDCKLFRNGVHALEISALNPVLASSVKFAAFGAGDIGGTTLQTYSDQEIGFISIGKGMTGAKMDAFDAALATLMTAWGR
ncbi:hypothetical protein E2R66_26950 [Mucilaginibacter psychrotolerans]|uniref:Uncharacterized protein n=2 Tax=Mucilaginibacter psychrotolerans TaxID=1524096 RepID=A0A4Y8S2D4_9SPHI|nr:hypothetical protein E2R66_26950 [Mucilaginibacter psychrotolerans]